MNCKFLKFYWITVLLVFFNSIAFSQDSDKAAVEEDSVQNNYEIAEDTVVTRTLFNNSNDSLIKWKHSHEFAYMAYLDSLLRKKNLKSDTVNIDDDAGRKTKTRRASATLNNGNSFLNSVPLKIFFWAAAIFFICFIIYKLFLTNGLFAKKTARLVDETIDGNPESLNDYSAYNLLIHEAELKSDFNLSVRYLYLQMLKRLTERELIYFSPGKTNDTYVHELNGRDYQREFAFLTLNYEYVWYGKFAISSNHYHHLKEEFISFNKKV